MADGRERRSIPAARASRARTTTILAVAASRSRGSPGQVDQGEEENPDHVDEMPIESGDGDRRVIVWAICVSGCAQCNEAEHDNADCNMHGMNSGRDEVDREELKGCTCSGSTDGEIVSRHEMFVKFHPVFQNLETQEN